VDLGIEAKIINIERTEKAKRKLLEEAKRNGAKTADKDAANPSNMYVQHDRYDTDIAYIKILLVIYSRNTGTFLVPTDTFFIVYWPIQ
jgi:hypothetical protein